VQKFVATFFLAIGLSFGYAQSLTDLKKEIESNLQQEYWKLGEQNIELLLRTYELDPKSKANYHHNLGLCKLEIKDFLGAQEQLQLALKLKEQIFGVNNLEYAKTARLYGDLSLSIGDYDIAKKYFLIVVEIAANAGKNTDAYVEALLDLGKFYEALGIYDIAHKKFEEALGISNLIHSKNSAEFASVLNNIGRIYILNNEIVLAESSLLTANKIYLALGQAQHIAYIESLENLAMLYEHKGDFSQAEKLLLSIEREKRALGGQSEELLLETLNDLGILYLDLNILDRSRSYFEEVERISKYHLGTDHKYYATAMNNLAAIAKEMGENEKARVLLTKALEIYANESGKMHPNYANALNNLASIERILGNYTYAEQHYEEVLEIDKTIYGKKHPSYATTINNLGILYSAMGEHVKAGQFYKLAIDIRRSTLGVNHPLYAKSLENLGLHHYVSGNLTEAEKCLKEAIDIQIAQISTIFPTLTEHERALFYQEIREDVERYTFIAYQLLDKNPDLIQNILNHQIATAGILFSSSERIRNAVFNSNDNQLIKQYTNWTAAKQQVAGYYQLGDAKLIELEIDLGQEEMAIEQMEKEMLYNSELFAGLFASKAPDWKDIRRKLSSDQALVQIIRFREFSSESSNSGAYFGFTDKVQYLYIVVKQDSYINPTYVAVENGAALEQKGFSLYNNSLKYESELQSSYLNYWLPLEPKLKGLKEVLVVPDGIYFKLNPNLLMTSATQYVFDQYNVKFLSSSTDLIKRKLLLPAIPKVTLVGNPTFGASSASSNFQLANLPGAKKEVDVLASMLSESGWEVTKYTGMEATEIHVTSSHEPNILHIATHGYFTPNDPVITKITPNGNPMFKSGLFLQGAAISYGQYEMGQYLDPNNDGILSSYEAMNMDLVNTNLVVLSACETALGDIEAGEGVYGLQRAMVVAGARNIITSLTKVDDNATQYLMEVFYREFIRSQNVGMAFRNAQEQLRSKYPDPRIWGAFLLTGN
jgi:CHAT domain-containing protein/Tfp pilus assembly protein PilF